MKRLALLITALVVVNANAKTKEIPNDSEPMVSYKTMEELDLERSIFGEAEILTDDIDMENLEVIEIEEEVSIDFDIKKHLPEGFNPLKGKDDLDWSAIELIELEEEVSLGFDTKKHLPKNFNALKGKHDLDWSSIELIELEEDIELGFDTKAYLPKGFDPHKGMCKKDVVVCLY